MANLLQSSQNKQTTAPGFYNDYLSDLATLGQKAAAGANFVDAQPLQTKAFNAVCQNFGAQQAGITQGKNLVGQASQQNVTGAAAPYLQAGTGSNPLNTLTPYANQAMCSTGFEAASPLVNQGASQSGLGSASPYLQQAATSGGLSAAQPYLQKATGTSPADLAAQYMNPYLQTAVQSMSDIGQRNIRQNLTPATTAAAVGSGQFGSRRGAQVQGQVQSQAQQDLNNQIAQMMSQGYGQALCAAGKQNALVANAGNTAGTLAQQQAGVLANVGSTAGSLTNQTAQNQINAGTNLGNLQQGANQITASLGSTAANAQAQQNQANLTAAQTAASAASSQGNLLNQAGQNMGNLAQTGANMNLGCINALSTLGGQQQTIGQNKENFGLNKLQTLGSLLQGYSIPTGTKTTLCMSPLSGASALGSMGKAAIACFSTVKSGLDKIIGSIPTGGGGGGIPNPDGTNYFDQDDVSNPVYDYGEVCDRCYEQYYDYGCLLCEEAKGGLIKAKARGYKGCASTTFRGGLPTKKG